MYLGNWFVGYSYIRESFPTTGRICNTADLQKTLPLHGLYVSSCGVPRSGLDLFINFLGVIFIVVVVRSKQRFLPVSRILHNEWMNEWMKRSIKHHTYDIVSLQKDLASSVSSRQHRHHRPPRPPSPVYTQNSALIVKNLLSQTATAHRKYRDKEEIKKDYFMCNICVQGVRFLKTHSLHLKELFTLCAIYVFRVLDF